MSALAPRGGNDNVMTPDYVAKRVVAHFKPCGAILEPCYGKGAFLRALQGRGTIFGYEINEQLRLSRSHGGDFLAYTPDANEMPYDWIVTNPPWSKFRPFLLQSMKVAENIVFLCLVNAWFMKARQEDIRKAGFGLVEILEIKQPPKPWPQTGFMLGAGWLRRGWSGATTFTLEKNDNSNV